MSLPETVSVEILQVYRRPIKCVIDNNLYSQVNSTQDEFQSALVKVDALIYAKLTNVNSGVTDPNDYLIVRDTAMLAINNQICL